MPLEMEAQIEGIIQKLEHLTNIPPKLGHVVCDCPLSI